MDLGEMRNVHSVLSFYHKNYVGKKIDRLLLLKEEMHFKAYWDVACSADKILQFAPKGMDGFVLGTTMLFGKNRSYEETIKEIRKYGMNMEP